MNTVKKIVTFLLALSVLFSQPSVAFASFEEQDALYLEQLKEMRAILDAEKDNPSRLGELREEYQTLRIEILEWRKSKLEERQAHAKKRLQMVRFYKEHLQSSPEAASPSSESSGVVVETQTGKASYYADKFNGRTTASGEIFSNSAMTAAHLTLSFGTRVRVTNASNGKTIEVIINDRGPYIDGRIIDLSAAAFESLDSLSRGVLDVTVEVLD